MTHMIQASQQSSRRKTILVLISGLVVLGIGGILSLQKSNSKFFFGSAEQNFGVLTQPAIEGPFEYTVTAKGVVNSRRFANLESEVDGFATVLWLIPAGTQVHEPLRSEVDGTVTSVQHPTPNRSIVIVTSQEGEQHRYTYEKRLDSSEVVVTPGDKVRRRTILAGDVVCRLDAAELELKEKNFEILVNDYKAEFDKAGQDIEIRRALNESNDSQARLDAELAELDLKKYLEGTYPQESDKLKGEIQQARESLKRAQEMFQFTQQVAEKGYKNGDQVEAARLNVLKLQQALDGKEVSLEVYSTYDHDRTLLELSEKAINLKRETKRIHLIGEAAMAQFRKILASRERVYNIYRERLEDIRRQIAACTVVATQAGQVVYATEGYRTPEPTEVGQQVRERQDLIHLPDLSDMMVDAGIHETLISYVHAGLPAHITVDSMPGVVFESRISELSDVPLPGQWPNYDRKEYRADFKIDLPENCTHQLRPGMTANVEILVEQIAEPVTQVPLQSVVKAGGHCFLWVATPDGIQRREIEVGPSNDETFVVTDGVLPGDQIVLQPQDHFADEIDELRERYEERQPPAQPPHEIARLEEDDFPQSEEEFLEMIGFYDTPDTRETDALAEPRKPKASAVSAVGD